MILTFTILCIAISIYNPQNLLLKAAENAYVASSTPNAGENVFVDAAVSDGFETALNLRNCTLQNRFEVGVIQQDSSGSTDGLPILKAVFDDLANAYASANADKGGYTLKMREFATNEEADEYVKEFAYRKKALCFVIGWNQFLPS